MKYRRLYQDEFNELRDEFIRFLAVNGLPADEWERIKNSEPHRTDQLLDQFSELVFERVLTDIRYLDWKRPRDLRTFHCLDDRILMNGLLIEGETTLDFTQNLPPDRMLQMLNVSGAALKFFSGERAYRKSREEDLFELMENGALISKDGNLYQTLESLKQ